MNNALTHRGQNFLFQNSISFSSDILSGLVALTDIVAIFLSGLSICLAYISIDGHTFSFYFSVVAINSLLIVISFSAAGLYRFERIVRPVHQIGKITSICTIVFLCFLLFIFSIKISDYFSRFWFFSWFCSSILLIYIGRIACYRIFYHWFKDGKITRNIVIIGAGEQGQKLLDHLNHSKEPWTRIVGIFDDRLQRTAPYISGYPLLGDIKQLLSFARSNRIDDIIIALPWNADQRIAEIVDQIKELPVAVQLGSDLVGLNYTGRESCRLGNAFMLNISKKPINGWSVIAKTLEDKVFSTLMLILFSPVLMLIAAMIKLDSKGPVIFRQVRHGFNNQKFMVYKFRTMQHYRPAEKEFTQATQNDPRVTRVGRFLRRTSLDELPQLFNVLQGTMSLVGPRPHAIAMDEKFAPLIDGYFARHRVKPGITGWAQVSGLRGETESPNKLKARVQHDIYYIEHWSLLFDIKILVMTLFVGFMHKNAY